MYEKFDYRFDRKQGILYKLYFGDITIKDIESSWELAKDKNLIPEGTKRFLLDYRKATFNMSYKEYPKIIEYYKNNLEIFGNTKIAIVTQNEKDIIIPTLVQSKDETYESKPFYTDKAAVQWLISE